MGTERRLPLSDAEVLAAQRAGESQRALAQRLQVSKGAVQKAIARAERRSRERNAKPGAPPGAAAAPPGRAMSNLDIRQRLEHEALNSTDARSRLQALRELRLLNESEGKGESKPPIDGACPTCGHVEPPYGVITVYPTPPGLMEAEYAAREAREAAEEQEE